MKGLEQPKIDVKKIQEAANKAAETAYLKAIDDYYTSYNSPFRQMINAELEKQKFKHSMPLPDVIKEINSALTQEVDRIANAAIASTYVPMVSKALVRMDKKIKLSDLFKMIIEELEPEREDYDEFTFSAEPYKDYSWLECILHTPKSHYEFTLHTVHDSDNRQILSFPRNKAKSGYNSKMTLYKDDIKIEMPFIPNVLEDKVLTIFFRLLLSNSEIIMDVKDFDEDMFPEEEHCHC